METVFEKAYLENDELNMDAISKAAAFLEEGKLVAFPTETVYGLGGNALSKDASKHIYAAKGRPSDNPLIVHVADIKSVYPLVKELNEKAKMLMEKFWPGPLTIILNKSDIVPYETTGGLDTVALRMPDNKAALKMIELSEVPVAAPSANTSGKPSPTKAEHVYEDLDGKISMILDGGEVGIGIESTIIDMTGDTPTILRPGYVTKNELSKLLGEVKYDEALLIRDKEKAKKIVPKAPGMKYRHYAPKADFILIEGDEEKVIEKINELVTEYENKGYKTGVICQDKTKDRYKCENVISLGNKENEVTISHNLYATLREFDKRETDYIFGETFMSDNLGTAIMNRMIKAAGYQIIDV